MSGVRTIATSMRAGVFLSLAFVVLIALAAGIALGAYLIAPRYTAHDIRTLLAAQLLPDGSIYHEPEKGQDFDQHAAFENFTGRLLSSSLFQGVAIFEHGQIIYKNEFDEDALPNAVREGASAHFIRNRLILNHEKAYYIHPVVHRQSGEAHGVVVLLELGSLEKPRNLAVKQALNNLTFLPFSTLLPVIVIFVVLILIIACVLTWHYLARPLSQALSMLVTLETPETYIPKGKIARLLAPEILSCIGRMHTRDENTSKNILSQLLNRRKGFDCNSFTAATAFAGLACNNGYADISPRSDGRYVFTLLSLPETSADDAVSLARVTLACTACAALAATSAALASSVNKYMRHAEHAYKFNMFAAQAAFAFFDTEKRVLDFCLLGKTQILRYDQRTQRLQGYFQNQATLGRLDPADFDARLGHSQIEINKGETLFFVIGDVDWEDVIKQVLRKSETDAEKQQVLLALLRQRIDEKHGAAVLMACFE